MTRTLDATTLETQVALDGYRAFLVERNGTANLLERRLDRRELFFEDLKQRPIASKLEIDREVFFRNLRRRRPERGLSPQMYWLLATAKLNQTERFGVGLGELYGVNAGAEVPPERVYLELEEHYHTRLLGYVLDMFGLPMQTVPPRIAMRGFVRIAVFIPHGLAAPFVGASEMAGCAMFSMLGARGVELFADEPDVAERIRLLYDEILTDEIGHVGICALDAELWGRRLMRRMYPLIGRYFARNTPEILAILTRREIAAHLDTPFDLSRYTGDLAVTPYVARHP